MTAAASGTRRPARLLKESQITLQPAPTLKRSERLRIARKKERNRLKRIAGKLMPHERVATCGRRRARSVDLYRSRRGTHCSGIETCGSIWMCPECAAKICDRRRREVEAAVNLCHAEGGATYLLTLTIRHGHFDDCLTLRKAVSAAWSKLLTAKSWREAKMRFGIFGFIRAMEVTEGANGWHPHLHVLLFAERPLTEEGQGEFHIALWNIWRDRIMKLRGVLCSFEASDFRQARAADYLTKWAAVDELVGGSRKHGKGGRSPWQLLEAARNGDKRAAALWCAYARAFKRARHLTWSQGLRTRYGIKEILDAEIAAEEDEIYGTQPLPLDDGMHYGRIGTVPGPVYDEIRKREKEPEALFAAWKGGWPGFLEFLSFEGIHFPEGPLKHSHTTPQPRRILPFRRESPTNPWERARALDPKTSESVRAARERVETEALAMEDEHWMRDRYWE